MKPFPDFPDSATQAAIRSYIATTWDTLTRDLSHPLRATEDRKVDRDEEVPKRLIYVSAQEDLNQVAAGIRRKIGDERFRKLELRVLPNEMDSIRDHGLLYLPGAYVVPGGRFNEFYGWDSYFIQRGLLRDGRVDLAASMVEQALYEVKHYGMVLNANRTYYLSRSHPPMLSLMIREQYAANQDRTWLQGVVPLLEKFYYYWRVPPHLNQATGLSRYYDVGQGPAPEVEFSEVDDAGRTHYDRMRDHLRDGNVHSYDVTLYYNEREDQLTSLAYTGDRSMRESGFDPTDRFGALNLDVIHYAPVCLNTLLQVMEADLSFIHLELGDADESRAWSEKANTTAAQLTEYFWNEEAGLYFDYNLRESQQRNYPFLTTLWPMWAGLSTPEQAHRIMENLELFLRDGGLQTSTKVTGEQWDAPFAWAPLQLFAVDAMERYGYMAEARDIARRFVSMVASSFLEEGVLLEKYDAVQCSGSVEGKIQFGYSTNEVGFGWTNSVLLEFLDRFSEAN